MKLRAPFALPLLLAAALPLSRARAQDAIDRLDMQAHAALDANQPETAIKDWTELLKLDPKNANAFFNRAAAYEELTADEPNQAAMAADDDKALADYTSAIQLNPDDPDALEHRARIYAQKIGGEGAYAENQRKAIADYEAAYTLRTKGMDDPKGWLTSTAKPDDDAGNIARWNLVIKLDPKDPQAYLNRALVHEHAADFASAAADYGEAARLDPGDVTTLVKQASDFFTANEYEKGIAGYTAALRLDPANVEALTQRAHIYVRRMMNDDFGSPIFEEDLAKAVADNEELLKIRMRDGKNPKEWLEKEAAVSTLTTPVLACRDMIVKLDPKDDKAYINRAAAYDSNGAYADAAADYSVAIRANPQDAGLYIERGGDFVQTGDYDKAIADFNEAFRLKPASDDDSAKARTGRALGYKG
ncbi:MAG TPA: tetratricopeptide repeat protein, partial [Chthoniobacteraceae bacterium]|nr:tetratricopeptide repeat protein [Chthoniobacteraceae bacterium]